MSSNDPSDVLFTKEEEDGDEVDEVVVEDPSQQFQQDQASHLLLEDHLPTTIITPSPFPQINDSSRFRTAYQRITANRYDREAWQAVITEASHCAMDASLSPPQLAWVVSCYGALLETFPYAVTHIQGVVKVLLQQKRASTATPVTQAYCKSRLKQIFSEYLGVEDVEEDDGEKKERAKKLVLCSWDVDLWLLYIRQVQEDGGDVIAAFEQAVSCAGDGYNNHVLWKAYTEFTADASFEQRRSVFQQLVVRPMTGLDQFWHQYEQFESPQQPVGATLVAEYQPKYQHARSIYLENAKVMQGHDLHYGMMDAGTAEDDDDDEALTAWLWKTAYERTRKTSLAICRQWYCQMVCTLTRHPEAWYMWAAFDKSNAAAIFDRASAVLPDSTLMAYCRAAAEPKDSVRILSAHVSRAPTSLGFILLQQAVRRTQSMEAARRVFSRARRVLESNNFATEAEQTNPEETEQDKDTEATARSQDSQGASKVKHRQVNGHATKDAASAEPKESTFVVPPGPVTWHLYAAHATMEQYQNQSPGVAARVYELGLRRHKQWITVPAYVRRYAALLTDETAVQALWKRAVDAATEPATRAALYQGWLEIATLLGGDAIELAGTLQLERHVALYGDTQDVVTGNWSTGPSGPLIGAQKITVSDYLVRERGMEASSKIVNGLSQVVDTLSIMGVWGDGSGIGGVTELPLDATQYYPGGASDIAMHKRLRRRHCPPTASAQGTIGKQSARDRLTTGGQPQQAGTAILMAIQQSPDWLQPLLYRLPASKLRIAMVAKPPPHLTEMALTALRQNPLPAERPIERKRKHADSSDDEDDEPKSSGYGVAFRKRQRARMMENGIGQLN